MKKLAVLILFGSGFHVSAQKDPEAKEDLEFRRMRLGIAASADISDRILFNVDGSETSASLIEYFNKTEVPRFAYSAGAIMHFNLSKHFSFETGLSYTNRGFRTPLIDLIGFTPDPSIPKSLRVVYGLNSLDIPAKFEYGFRFEKARFFVVAGAAVNFIILSSQRSVSIFEDGSIERKTHVAFVKNEVLNISPCAGFGMEYYFQKTRSLVVSPVFRFTALGYGNGGITSRIWNAGIQTSFFF